MSLPSDDWVRISGTTTLMGTRPLLGSSTPPPPGMALLLLLLLLMFSSSTSKVSLSSVRRRAPTRQE